MKNRNISHRDDWENPDYILNPLKEEFKFIGINTYGKKVNDKYGMHDSMLVIFRGKKTMKRGYFVTSVNCEWGVACVAHSAREAKKIVWDKWWWEFEEDWIDWIDLRANWQREAIVEDLPYGIVDNEAIFLSRRLINYMQY